MKTKNKTIRKCGVFVLFSILGSQCVFGAFKYAVALVNRGSEEIMVERFALTGDPGDDYMTAGNCAPNGGTSVALPFSKKPLNEVVIEWKNQKTGQIGKAKIKIDLPKEFTPKYGSEIRFIIYPENERIDVTYTILNPKTGERATVNSSRAAHTNQGTQGANGK